MYVSVNQGCHNHWIPSNFFEGLVTMFCINETELGPLNDEIIVDYVNSEKWGGGAYLWPNSQQSNSGD